MEIMGEDKSLIESKQDISIIEKTYNISEVSEMIGVEKGAIRHMEDKLGDFLSIHRDQKGNRLFTTKDIDFIKQVFEVRTKFKINDYNAIELLIRHKKLRYLLSNDASLEMQYEESSIGLDGSKVEELMSTISNMIADSIAPKLDSVKNEILSKIDENQDKLQNIEVATTKIEEATDNISEEMQKVNNNSLQLAIKAIENQQETVKHHHEYEELLDRKMEVIGNQLTDVERAMLDWREKSLAKEREIEDRKFFKRIRLIFKKKPKPLKIKSKRAFQ